jgi:hypothetical protein
VLGLQLTLVVALSMAITPYLATLGAFISKRFAKQDIAALQVRTYVLHYVYVCTSL